MKSWFFGVPWLYNRGMRPSLGIAGGKMVGVHQWAGREHEIRYRLGSRRDGFFDFQSQDTLYGTGCFPAVAVDTQGNVVAVHESFPLGSWNLHYAVGKVNDDLTRIEFGSVSGPIARGGRAKVAVNDQGLVVVVHQVEPRPGVGRLRYQVGNLDADSKKIDFGDPQDWDEGWAPSVAINGRLQVVVTYRRLSDHRLLYRVGSIVSASKRISFGDAFEFGTGTFPTVALNDQGFVVAAHEGAAARGRFHLWVRTGELAEDEKVIHWTGESVRHHDGSAPSVALDGRVAVLADHRPPLDTRPDVLQLAESIEIERRNWMAESRERLGDKKLMEIALPGSHDAGMSYSRDCQGFGRPCNTKTQNLIVSDQLEAGCRYFDLRPAYYQDLMHTGHFSIEAGLAHGCFGELLSDVLEAVAEYFRHGGSDLVICKFSHYRDIELGRGSFTPEQMQELVADVKRLLGPFLYRGAVPAGGLQSLTVNDFLGAGGKALAVFDGLPAFLRSPDDGIYTYADRQCPEAGGPDGPPPAADLVVFDCYRKTNDLATMAQDQLQKLRAPENRQGNLFLLSWTLTQSLAQQAGCPNAGASILDLARQANEALWVALVEAYERTELATDLLPNVVYTDDVGDRLTEYVVALNRLRPTPRKPDP
jgi:hypothetical protein